LHKCPNCGAEVEMFSDETRVRCHVCRGYVHKEEVPSCISWCAKARECLGEERWRALMGQPDGKQGEETEQGEEADA
jgi:NADH pyrophosphatase NudC (nudix superfamily)